MRPRQKGLSVNNLTRDGGRNRGTSIWLRRIQSLAFPSIQLILRLGCCLNPKGQHRRRIEAALAASPPGTSFTRHGWGAAAVPRVVLPDENVRGDWQGKSSLATRTSHPHRQGCDTSDKNRDLPHQTVIEKPWTLDEGDARSPVCDLMLAAGQRDFSKRGISSQEAF